MPIGNQVPKGSPEYQAIHDAIRADKRSRADKRIFTVHHLIELCEEWSRMGGAVQDQFLDVLKGESFEEQNPAALSEIRTWLNRAAELGVNGAAIYVEDITEVIGQ